MFMTSLLDGVEDFRFKEYYIKYCKYFKIPIENEKSLLDFIYDVFYCTYNTRFSYPYNLDINTGKFETRDSKKEFDTRCNYKKGVWAILDKYIENYEHINWDN